MCLFVIDDPDNTILALKTAKKWSLVTKKGHCLFIFCFSICPLFKERFGVCTLDIGAKNPTRSKVSPHTHKSYKSYPDFFQLGAQQKMTLNI